MRAGRASDTSNLGLAATSQHHAESAVTVCMHSLQPVRDDPRPLRMATALAQAGYRVSIIDIEHDRSRPREENLRALLNTSTDSSPNQENDIVIRHVFVPAALKPFYDPTNYVMWLVFKCWRIIIALLPLLMSSADIYHASDIAALPASYTAARLRRKRLVFDSHELPLVQSWITRSVLLHAVSTSVLRVLARSCTAIITVSPPVADEFHRRYGGKMPQVVRNIPPFQRPVASDRIRQYAGLSPDAKIALYQGGMAPDRGLDVLVRAAKFLDPGAVIVIMGDGGVHDELVALADTAQVRDRVRFIPAAPYKDLLEWTASADIGLVIFRPLSLSVQMCLPNKLFEYLMAGAPVLTSSLEAVVEVVQAYDVGAVVTSIEPEAVARAINAMLANPQALARMRNNALSACSRELRWEVEQQRLVEIYEAMLYPRSGASGSRDVSLAPDGAKHDVRIR